MNENIKKIAVVPGSFDPITYGHIEIVKQALTRYDTVYVAVMINAAKQYLFSMEERTEIAKAALADFERVQVIASEGMLWELAKQLQATGIVKGYRNERDLAYEQEMAAFNLAHNPSAPTELFSAAEEFCEISSTLVRDRIRDGASLEGYLPSKAIAVIKKIISERAPF